MLGFTAPPSTTAEALPVPGFLSTETTQKYGEKQMRQHEYIKIGNKSDIHKCLINSSYSFY